MSSENLREHLSLYSSTTFENLIFDLCLKRGFRNLVWRTPGADGGRDIDGSIAVADASGGTVTQKWHIECKRYTNSIDWPTIWNKLAYADVAGADFLLIATNSTLSPNCESAVEKWNFDGRSPKIRAWRIYDLSNFMNIYPDIAVKYGINTTIASINQPFRDLAKHSASISQSAYSAQFISGFFSRYVECAAALSELLMVRMEDIERYGRIVSSAPKGEADFYDWLNVVDSSNEIDVHGLRAIATLLRLVRGVDDITLKSCPEGIKLDCDLDMSDSVEDIWPALGTVAFWAEFELKVQGKGLLILRRAA